MAAPKGNKFWLARSSHGRKPIFANPDKLWEACCEYFQWVEKNPLKEQKLFAFQGVITKSKVNKSLNSEYLAKKKNTRFIIVSKRSSINTIYVVYGRIVEFNFIFSSHLVDIKSTFNLI